MAYNGVTQPRFYIDEIQYLKSIGFDFEKYYQENYNNESLQGFQIKGVDLHKHMLENGYGTRSVHEGSNSFSFIKESRAAGRLDLDGGIPTYGAYSANKPEPGARL